MLGILQLQVQAHAQTYTHTHTTQLGWILPQDGFTIALWQTWQTHIWGMDRVWIGYGTEYGTKSGTFPDEQKVCWSTAAPSSKGNSGRARSLVRCKTKARMPADAPADAERPLRRTTADAKNPGKKAADGFPAVEKYKVIQKKPPCGCRSGSGTLYGGEGVFCLPCVALGGFLLAMRCVRWVHFPSEVLPSRIAPATRCLSITGLSSQDVLATFWVLKGWFLPHVRLPRLDDGLFPMPMFHVEIFASHVFAPIRCFFGCQFLLCFFCLPCFGPSPSL